MKQRNKHTINKLTTKDTQTTKKCKDMECMAAATTKQKT